jgi:hypothetical protein
MKIEELRDADRARRFLVQGLWLQRVRLPQASGVREPLEWARELAAQGRPLPPLGFVADVGFTALAQEFEEPTRAEAPPLPALPINLIRTYEDHVLGKLYADWTFARAADALRRPLYQGRDRARGLAFLLARMGERAGFGGVELSPSVLQAALDAAPEDLLRHGWESLRLDGPMPLLIDLYEGLIVAARRTAEVLGRDDCFELESGAALADEGGRLARRQVLRAAELFDAALPVHRPRQRSAPRDVPTRILAEDVYPVGGFSSLSNRGSVESLLQSQLAFMEKEERPDLFDVKYLRDELLYYSRDENEFRRRRRTFVFALSPSLVAARFLDAGLPYQRGVLLLGLVLTAIRKLTEWLRTDALFFEIVFLVDSEEEPLAEERKLVETLLRDQIQNHSVRVVRHPSTRLGEYCAEIARRSLCQVLLAAATPTPPPREAAALRLLLNGPRPRLDDDAETPRDADDAPLLSWERALSTILRSWMQVQ